MSAKETLRLPAGIYDAMLDHARSDFPMECCGLIVGQTGCVTRLVPLRNSVNSPTRYEADVRELFEAFRDMRNTGEELIAIYHSHPTSAAIPSRVDLRENYYGLLPRIIISLVEPVTIKAFLLYEDRYDEIPCERETG